MASGHIAIGARRLWFEGGVVTAIVAMAFYIGAWKSQQEEAAAAMSRQIQELSQQVSSLAARPITSEADRRLSVAEAQISAQALTVSEMKIDIGKRLDRLEQQNDMILRELKAQR